MNKKIITAILAAAMCCGILTSCGDKTEKGSSASGTSSEASSDAEKTSDSDTEEFDKDAYIEKIKTDIDKAEPSDEPLEYGSIGKEEKPDEDADDADLGDYSTGDSGVKFYYDKSAFPDELMLTLEQYFHSFENADYTTYTRCSYPDYLEKMEEYLQKEYGYAMKDSFTTQCANLAGIANGEFKVTRIKVDVPQQYDPDKENLEAYFENFVDIFGEDYYEKLSKEADKVYDGEFYVMAENSTGAEQILVSAYEIVFVEKDGRFYVFG